MREKHNLFIFAGIFLLILIGYMGYMLYTNPVVAPAEKENTENLSQVDLPEGVEIVERGGERFVRDDRNKIEIKVEEDIDTLEYHNDALLIKEKIKEDNDSGYISSYNIKLIENEDKNIESWIKDWVNEQEYSKDYSYKKEEYNNSEFYIINVPSYADSEKVLVFKNDDKFFYIDLWFKDPILVFKNKNIIKK